MGGFAVVLSLCAVSIVSSTSASRRGFIAVRGKRSTSQLGPDELINFVPYESYENNLGSLSPWSKRVPVPGFIGMRGKRDDEYSDYSRRAQDGAGPRIRIQRPNFKRISQQIPQKPDNKRVPMGFIGVYGKKDLTDMDQYDDLDDNFGGNFNGAYDTSYDQQLSDWQDISDVSKRVPGSGFFGMRGKRLFDVDPYNRYNSLYEKRAPTGFVGMRGKKSYDQLYDAYEDDKNEPTGLLGTWNRWDDNASGMNEKRSFANFFGTRGKKQPFNSGFFGMRGKKQPFEFRSKFIGVRGKKIPEGILIQHHVEEEPVNDENSNSVNLIDDKTKRVPSGFVGMRGKKESDGSSTGN